MAIASEEKNHLSPVDNDNDGGPLYRVPPHNLEAEKALLGAIFANNRAFEQVGDFLRPEHFADPVHGRIYDAIMRLLEKGQIASPVTLTNFFEQDESLREVGGKKYLAELAASVPTIINAKEYGRIVYDLHVKRQLIALGEDMVNRAFDAEVDETASEQIEEAEQELYDLASEGEYDGGFRSFRDSVSGALEIAELAHNRDGGLAGTTTGLRDLDELLGGLHKSDLVILAGRPGMGKTALATNIAFNAAYAHHSSNGEEGAGVAFFSLEMSAEQLAARIISEQANMSSDKMRKGHLSDQEFDALAAASQTLYDLPIYIDDTPALTVSALRTRARRLKRKQGIGLVVVDYLQLVAGSATRRNESRVQEISEITRGLKTLAKELEVPVLALSQLSRAVEQREDKRPQLADLRESGTIEQDADVVAFIYREAYYLDSHRPQRREGEDDVKYDERVQRWEERLDNIRNVAEVIIAKQRHGPVGTVRLFFDGQFTRFGDLDQTHSGGDF